VSKLPAEADRLLAELARARAQFEAADRRARTYLAERGLLEQTRRDLTAMLREAGKRKDAS
jgi:hypothetical protein